MLKLRELRGIFYVAYPANFDPNRSRRDGACAGGISLTSCASDLERCGGYLRAGIFMRSWATPRLFTGLELPQIVVGQVALARGDRRARAQPEDYHVTLRFVGDV